LLGATLSRDAISAILNKLAIGTRPDGDDVLVCTVPPQRRDLTREVDLIEEVARVRGLDAVDVHVKLPVTVKPPQNSELARRDLAATLTGLGFFETVTFSFVTREAAAAFLPRGMKVVEVSEDRRKAEPACRPSIMPGLLACRRANQHGGVRVAGGVRLFEVAAVFAQDAAGKSVEEKKLALMVDVPFSGKSATVTDRQQGLRLLRGAIEAMVRNLAGAAARVKFAASSPHCDGLDATGFALVSVDDVALGYAGFVSAAQNSAYDLPGPVAVAELSLERLMTSYPPRARIVLPPEFPGIERDVSFIVDESVTWEQLEGHIRDQHSPMCEGAAFVGTFRGTQIGKGKKSVTVRLSYRDPARTLRHEEIDGPVAALIEALRVRVGATLRT
jgi:phenylalanyl-tRNA synthetase beta chain